MTSILANMMAYASLLPSMVPFAAYEGMTAPAQSTCRVFPGDFDYPSLSIWNEFNQTLGGKLVASIPLAAVCHNDPFAVYSQEACANLQDNWFFPETHLTSSSSAMAFLFTNNSCNPFLPQPASCTLGKYVSYSVNATTAADVQEAVKFVNQQNIRLIIRGTGHDYNGKSTGAGALAVWTHYMTSISLDETYSCSAYQGKAAVIGAGISSLQAYEFADANNGIIVAGNGATVSLAGGFTQGGGHGPLATKFGLAVDQVLEWEVVTGTGQLVRATPTENSDLFFALAGGGGGTYGVVISMTVKFHPPSAVSSANLLFTQPTNATSVTQYWASIKVFLESLPSMVDSGLQIVWTAAPGAFMVTPATGVGIEESTIDSLFKPTLNALTAAGIPYNYVKSSYSTFLSSYQTTILSAAANVSNSVLAGRLINRVAIENSSEEFIAVLQNTVNNNYIMTGVTLDVSKAVPVAPISVNPYWRQTLFNAVFGTFFNYSDFQTNFALQNFMTETLGPSLAAITPNGAAYINEADFQQPDWQAVFFGENYDKLDAIKAKYDPKDRFYALKAVGSDRWTERLDGRLCKT